MAQKNITPETLEKIKQNVKKDKAFVVSQNAVSNNSLNKVAQNRSFAGSIDHYFKYKVKVSGITDQKNSGRCWMFTGFNLLRPKVMEKLGISDFEFSTNYLYFWDQFEKANFFLENIIETRSLKIDDRKIEWLFKNVAGDGGVWSQFADLVTKYGAIPKSVMPETQNSENTSNISKILALKLREDALILRKMATAGDAPDKLSKQKIEMLADIYKILAICLGEPPVNFSWRYKDKDGKLTEDKQYTPKSFYQELVGINLSDYVMLMNDPTRDFDKLYEIEFDRSMVEGGNWKYINLKTDKIKVFAKKALMENEALYFSCDVGKQLNKDDGFLALENFDYESVFGMPFAMDKKERILTFESGSSHGMALVGVDVDKSEKITKWLLENSWGSSSGKNGYLTMTDTWFDEFAFRVVVPKKFIDADVLKILEQKAIFLPPWDPMFQMEN